MKLYRPVGLEELRLIVAMGMRGFPPRLPEQPIFYPVLNEGYARQIARDWNTKSGLHAGFVTRFEIDDAYATKFERQVVGARKHEELWVSSEELGEFNAHIVGSVEVIGAYYGSDYRGVAASDEEFVGKNASEQIRAFARVLVSEDR